MNKLDELYRTAKTFNKSRKTLAEKNVNEVLGVIFAEIPSLQEIKVKGWTPGFNDGDPCTHRQAVSVGTFDPEGYFDDGEEVEESLDVGSEDHPEHSTYEKAHTIVETLEDDFSAMFDTNFELSISRSNAKLGFTIHKDNYDCGY